jgi:hypothetical protein
VKTATSSWPHQESDPERLAILAAADRLLADTATRSTGNLSVVQLAVEADVKYWVVAQKHTDLRDHFQQLAVHARHAATVVRDHGTFGRLQREHHELNQHCTRLEELVQTYAVVINELALENSALREEATRRRSIVTPLPLTPRTTRT